jgi:transcriptional regulator with PAS, ATPase and Fis domain
MIPVNVRIIAATNKKLEEAIARDRFRRDLYYRLGVIKLVIPPLRERKDDIPLLVEHFLKIICKRFDKPVKKLTPEAIDVLMAYDWPGNIRELQNVLEVAIQLSPGEFIYHEFLTRYLEPGNHLAPAETRKTVYPVENFNTQHQEIPEEQRVLEQTLRKNKWNKSKTAEDLGISRQCLYRRLYKYNLVSPSDLM